MAEASCNFYGTRVLVLFEIAVSYAELQVVCRMRQLLQSSKVLRKSIVIYCEVLEGNRNQVS